MCILICYTSLLFLKKKTFATLVTLIWLFTSMHSLVYYKILSHTEPFVTGCIGMVFPKYVFSGVPSKTFFTLVTLIWIFTSMHSLVYYKILSHTEPFVTGCIGMVFLKYVFSGVPSKTFFTLVALIWFLLIVYYLVSTRHIFQAKHLSHCLHTYSLPPLCVLW